MTTSVEQNYVDAYRGNFTSLLRWHHLDEFWETLKHQADNWFIYAVGEAPPETTASKEHLLKFIDEIDALLHKDHEHDYCGIVYTDSKEKPAFIKIFDPHNLGVSCGFSENPPLPGWILSKIQPVELERALKPPKNRQHWWNKIFD
ncbi:MAG: hypothetical protein OEZ15_07625 [Gammaproteobacteria bacterium]|nr:hypothetical protein [Gammaproteobacteria bacterium]